MSSSTEATSKPAAVLASITAPTTTPKPPTVSRGQSGPKKPAAEGADRQQAKSSTSSSEQQGRNPSKARAQSSSASSRSRPPASSNNSNNNIKKDEGAAGDKPKAPRRQSSSGTQKPTTAKSSNAGGAGGSKSSPSGTVSTGGAKSSSSSSTQQQQRRVKSPATGGHGGGGRGKNSGSSSASSTAGGGDKNTDAFDSLQRVIGDLKGMPPKPASATDSPPTTFSKATALISPRGGPRPIPIVAPPPTQPAGGSAATAMAPSPSFTPKAPNPNAAVFHPSQATLDQVSEEQDSFDHNGLSMPPIPASAVNAPHRGGGQQQQVPMGSFTAPRFAALAAQQGNDAAGASAAPGGGGRPVLAPQFTFGVRRRTSTLEPAYGGSVDIDDDTARQQFGITPLSAGPVVPGIGGLLGLAARAHRRTGSEMSPAMAEQVRLQQQIEELQRQQRELILNAQQQQPTLQGSFGSLPENQPLGMDRHRRVQSVAPSPTASSFGNDLARTGNFGQFHQPQQSLGGGATFGGVGGGGGAFDSLPSGHGRRHSVNLASRVPGGGSIGGSAQMNNLIGGGPGGGRFDWADEPYGNMSGGFQSGNHSRQSSTMEGSWRMNGGVGSVQQQGGGMSGDLAQAQAQLQSIAAFRAAAGGGHSKMASFALPNMLPNMLYANSQPYFNIPQQLQAFQLQIQQQQQQPQRKSLFSPYLPAASLPPLLAAGKLVIGILRVNKRNRSDAYIATEVLDADIYISGSRDRNRALDGDTVAVELLDVDEVWASKKEKEDKKRKKEENAAYNSYPGGAGRAVGGLQSAAARRSDKKKDDVEVEGQGMMLFDDEEVNDETKPQFAGHVVAVVERMPGQLFSGTLGLLRPSSAVTKEKQEAERREREGPGADKPRQVERPKIVWFKPTDKRVPLIAIPTEQAPADFLERSDAYASTLFCACIKRWPITSLHPFGTLVEEIGTIGQVEVETSALLKDCNFPTEDFSESVLKCLPPLPWSIPEREIETRKDLRETRVFTIDPMTAKDLDDALSVIKNEDGTYEVGVHIADVSHFVKPGTALDRDARKRATSVYLVQRAVPMLPPALSEQLCSLIPGEDRLTFSIFLTITADGRVVKTSFAKSVIRSCAKIAYADAQDVIEGRSLNVELEENVSHKVEELEADIKQMQTLAKKMADRRFENGALQFDNLKLQFTLDDEGRPTDCFAETRKESNYLVQEFMLQANISAATQIAANLPEQALLRRHESPSERRIDAYVAHAARLGFELDGSSAGALQTSLAAVKGDESKLLLELLAGKGMHKAKYFCSGMIDIAKYSHYALNAPLYTHFTSPIRRYADVVVHRQLLASLDESSTGQPQESRFQMDRDTVAKTAQNCNMKKEGAKLAQEQSAHLFLCVLLHDLTERYGSVIREASVVNVLDEAFDVVVSEFGIEKRVHADQMPLDNLVYDEHAKTLQLYWSERDVIAFLAERGDDDHLNKVKKAGDHHAALETGSAAAQAESALFDDDDEEEEEEHAEQIVARPGTGKKLSPEEEKSSVQRSRSATKTVPTFQGLKSQGGHRIQEIKELMKVPVIISADMEKSPPVIKVFAVNPYAKKA